MQFARKCKVLQAVQETALGTAAKTPSSCRQSRPKRMVPQFRPCVQQKKHGSGLCVAISHFSSAFLLLEEKKNDNPTNFYFLFCCSAKKRGVPKVTHFNRDMQKEQKVYKSDLVWECEKFCSRLYLPLAMSQIFWAV